MGRLGIYKVELKGMKDTRSEYQWTVDQDFFSIIEGEEVKKGNVAVTLTVTKQPSLYLLKFDLQGHVYVPCDRCLDDMSLDIDTTGELKVKLGADFADDGDIIIVPEEDGAVNVAWYIYEFIALAIPIKHVHAPGKCNKGMMEKLEEHMPGEDEEGESSSQDTDPRWDQLKNILETDND